ncbi:hypothetical protein, partial [Vibrio parahaemolyticus]|uniref:hypothetical protein n=1 Tax=Vibrio parahaemolyticus TaxID=670 RepID=UPI0021116162
TKPNLNQVDASGEQLRQIFLREETDAPHNNKDQDAETSQTEESYEEDDVGALIDRLNCMSDEEIQQYFNDRYGIKSTEPCFSPSEG